MRARTLDLLDRFRLGDAGAYEILWRRYEKPLRRFIAHHTRGAQARELADDLFQETHLAALKRIKTFVYRRELAFFFWLCEIARRRIARQHRKNGRDLVVQALELPSAADDGDAARSELLARLSSPERSPLDAMADRQLLGAMALGLDALAPRRREAIVLRYVEGLPNEEAAKVLGTTAGAFRVTLSRALDDLRAAIAGRG